jgi:mevalonate kinase
MKKNPEFVTSSASGSLMLLGEHAVLHGRRALVCAIDRRINVALSKISKPILRIVSDLGSYESPLDNLTDHPNFRFVLDAVKQYPREQGIELKIGSDFSSDIGFGSSAAVTVATHAALMQSPRSWTSATEEDHCRAGAETPPLDKEKLFKRSLATVHRVQGRGSGADVAASVFGGVVAYRAEPLEIYPMGESFPLTAVYSGSKMKTVDVIRHLEERRSLNVDYFEKIFDRMDTSVGEVIEDFKTLGKNLILNQKLMEEMGLSNAALTEIIQIFQALETPAKISGSGLGDCAIGLGSVAPTGLLASGEKDKPFGNYPGYALDIDPQGVFLNG